MVKIIIYDDKTAPLYQLLNNNNMVDLFKTIQSYREPFNLPKLSYLKQLKHIQEVAFFNDETILNVIKKKGMWWVFYYNDCKILSLL